MKNVIGVRFMPVGPISYYEAGQTKYKMDEKLIINNGNVVDIGQVVIVDKQCKNDESGIHAHKHIIRVATEKDLEQDEKNRAEAKFCRMQDQNEAAEIVDEADQIGIHF